MNNFSSNPVQDLSVALGIPPMILTIVLTILAIWALIWKGLGMWHAAQNHQKYWFLAFLIINDLGILEIIYLLWFRNDKKRMMPAVASESSAPVDAA
ncbi:MAG: hypothetical protein JWL88_191 [Parcubacteria group bacterium]|nr:hypothetical protein [Parcubacteria group bacterium]